ncbi:nitroreductase family deazaflavin-dependent oxidoreductase [Speluncibacter jeojiensis]|uniref:Nitroreductase family deazaflavin-dependent oxidoreductase n=1 Tax=Speluncibacter jeojiensis TaxID=2710754 RepID=A0A9X4LXZ0_9ACTN|nr:nitroreductase family deazaflavin-dependent oxidoreductase [Corynebacteriales bacterium D3-21]
MTAPVIGPRPRSPLAALGRWVGSRELTMRLRPLILFLESHLRAWTNNRVSLVGIAGLPSLQITVPGRKTGLPRTTALLCVPCGRGYVVAGSNWGLPKHPVWSANLRAVDTARVKVGAAESEMRVRMVEGDERAALWQGLVHYWPGYAMEHRLACGREFRVFLLEPEADAAAQSHAAPESHTRRSA